MGHEWDLIIYEVTNLMDDHFLKNLLCRIIVVLIYKKMEGIPCFFKASLSPKQGKYTIYNPWHQVKKGHFNRLEKILS